MKKKLLFGGSFAAILAAALLAFFIYKIPDEYHCIADQPPQGSLFYTLEADQAAAAPGGEHYTAKVKLFGLLPIKNATIHRISQKQLVVLGTPFGVKLYTKGVIVVDAEEDSAGIAAGIRIGDIILSYNDTVIHSNEELAEEVQKCGGKRQRVELLRNHREQTLWVTPAAAENGYEVGLWVRDSAAGLGTLTYYDPQTNSVAGLGHSISDVDTGLTMPLERGTLVTASITGVHQGEKGEPGELLGKLSSKTLAEVTANNDCGIYGEAEKEFSGVSYPIALKKEIEVGPAQILCTIEGSAPRSYEITITKINNNLAENRNLCLQVTDARLLAATGGIVQGMSGSPILQNGKLIGAVTHVLISDPTAGYGIFIENMLKDLE